MRSRDLLLPLVAFLALVAAPACQPAETGDGTVADTLASEPGVVEVTARDFAFEAPDTIASGWTTFRMENAGEQEHFMVLWRMPEGRTLEDYRSEVVAAFDSIMEPYRAGEWDRATALETLGGLIPEWYGGVRAAGGPGLVAPGGTARTTVALEPGTYVMECYVKTPDGRFHGSLGMLRALVVTADSTGVAPPEPDVRMTLSNYAIDVEGALDAGENVVQVAVAEDPEGLLPHDVQLARLAEDTPVDSVVAWMDWMDALTAPATATFVGGAEQMLAGDTAYVRVELEAGRYLWLSEVYGDRGMVREFTVE